MTANVPPNQTVYVNNLPEKLKKDGKLLTLAHTTDSLFFSFSFYLPLPPFPSSPLSPSAVTSAGGWCVFAPSLQIATSFLPRYSLVFYCMMCPPISLPPNETPPKSGSKRSPWSPGHSHLLLLPSSPSSSTPLPTHGYSPSLTHTHTQIYRSRSTPTPLHLHLYTYTYTYIHTYIQILSPFPPPLSPPLPLPLLFSPRVEEAALRHLQSVRPRPRHRRPENVSTPWSGVDCL